MIWAACVHHVNQFAAHTYESEDRECGELRLRVHPGAPGYLLTWEHKSQNLPHTHRFPSELVSVLHIGYECSLEIISEHYLSCNY